MLNVVDEFTREYPDYAPKSKFAVSRKRFAQWLDIWGAHNKMEVTTGRDQGGDRWTTFGEPNTAVVEDVAPF